jgi:hypothetical protein
MQHVCRLGCAHDVLTLSSLCEPAGQPPVVGRHSPPAFSHAVDAEPSVPALDEPQPASASETASERTDAHFIASVYCFRLAI